MEVNIERKFKASCERLYQLWTEQSQISKWFGVKVEIDPKIGGQLKFVFDENDVTTGEYKELVPFNRLAFTWNTFLSGEALAETLVTVTFEKVDESNSKMRIVHTGFESEKAKNDHLEGWEEYFTDWAKKLEQA